MDFLVSCRIIVYSFVNFTIATNPSEKRNTNKILKIQHFWHLNCFNSIKSKCGPEIHTAKPVQTLQSQHHLNFATVEVCLYFDHVWRPPKTTSKVVIYFNQCSHLPKPVLFGHFWSKCHRSWRIPARLLKCVIYVVDAVLFFFFWFTLHLLPL